MLRVFGIALIQHGDTDIVYEIDRGSLDLDSATHFARKEGVEMEHYATVDHEQLGRLTWTIWENSSGSIDYHDYDIKNHKLLKNFKFRLADEIPDDEERQRNIDEMVEWFKKNYRNIDEGGLYFESKAGGYVGDIRDASEELQGKFPYEYDDVIEAAVEEIEASGNTEWTPIYDDKELLINDSLEDIEYELNTLIDNSPETKTDPAFILGDDNLFHITLPPDNQTVDNQDELLDELRTIIDDLLESLVDANVHLELIPIIERYKEAISGNQISISRLYARGTRLDNALQITNNRIESEGLQSLRRNTESNFKSALKIHGNYIMSHVEGRRLVQDAVTYNQSPEQTEKLKKASEQLSNIITESRNLFGEDVREHVRDVLMDIAQGQHPERSNQNAGNTLTNMVSGILRWIKRTSTQAISEILLEAFINTATSLTGIVRGVSVINVALGILMNIAPLLLILVAPLAGELSWLASAAHLLERIRIMFKDDN